MILKKTTMNQRRLPHSNGGLAISIRAWRAWERTIREAISKLNMKQSHQRVVLVIDRRDRIEAPLHDWPTADEAKEAKAAKKDHLHVFEPNEYSFVANEREFLAESLIANMQKCLLPKMKDAQTDSVYGNEDVGINTVNIRPLPLTLSFQCFAADEVRAYLCFNGWGTRFFIEDIKHLLS